MQNILCKTDCGHGMMAYKSKALLVLRLAAGIIFVMHGWDKLTPGGIEIAGFADMLTKIGWPVLPLFFAWVVALTEFVGGIALILGIFTRPAGVLLSIVMLVAWGMAKKFALPAGDADFALLSIALALAMVGPGSYSVASMMMKDKHDMEKG